MQRLVSVGVKALHRYFKISSKLPDPNGPTLEKALVCRQETDNFHCWAIPALLLACSTALFAALITSGGTVFDKGVQIFL